MISECFRFRSYGSVDGPTILYAFWPTKPQHTQCQPEEQAAQLSLTFMDCLTQSHTMFPTSNGCTPATLDAVHDHDQLAEMLDNAIVKHFTDARLAYNHLIEWILVDSFTMPLYGNRQVRFSFYRTQLRLGRASIALQEQI